uniref:Uncharacterized protein n=1 Tax=Oryzias melastigma TaxID=30732 RepID=A0A3B3B3K9_ORYME
HQSVCIRASTSEASASECLHQSVCIRRLHKSICIRASASECLHKSDCIRASTSERLHQSVCIRACMQTSRNGPNRYLKDAEFLGLDSIRERRAAASIGRNEAACPTLAVFQNLLMKSTE